MAVRLPDLYLIRHGQTLWNAEGRLQGRLDSPLTDLGRAQAAALRPLLCGLTARRLSSPLGRAVQTARILFGDGPFATDDRLAEIDLGGFSGRLLADLRADLPDAFADPPHAWYDRIPDGEGLAGLSDRLSAFLADLPGPAVIVTHGMALAMLCSLATGQPLHRVHAACQRQDVLHVVRSGRHDTVSPGDARAGQDAPPALEARPAGG